MSIRAMFRRCTHCGRLYYHDPSRIDVVQVCEHCGRPQASLPFPVPQDPLPDGQRRTWPKVLR